MQYGFSLLAVAAAGYVGARVDRALAHHLRRDRTALFAARVLAWTATGAAAFAVGLTVAG